MYEPTQAEFESAEITLSICLSKLSTKHPAAIVAAMDKFGSDFQQLRSDSLERMEDERRQQQSKA